MNSHQIAADAEEGRSIRIYELWQDWATEHALIAANKDQIPESRLERDSRRVREDWVALEVALKASPLGRLIFWLLDRLAERLPA